MLTTSLLLLALAGPVQAPGQKLQFQRRARQPVKQQHALTSARQLHGALAEPAGKP